MPNDPGGNDDRRTDGPIPNDRKKFWIDTYGCQMNMAESASMESSLIGAGWCRAEGPQDADLVVLHTCAVRESAERRVRGRLGELGRIKKTNEFTLVLSGCMAEKLKMNHEPVDRCIDYLIGPMDRGAFVDALCAVSETKRTAEFTVPSSEASDRPENVYRFEERYSLQDSIQSFVPIMHGCNNFCSYCIIPYVRGPEISRPFDAVLREVVSLSASGSREITFLGQNVNSYSHDGVDFPLVLEKISQVLPEDVWIRFLSPHPKDFSERLIDVMSLSANICNHVHLPVQHGSDRILAAMNRKYDRARFMAIVQSLRRAMPGIAVSTDILIGFPGESEADFEATLSLVEEVEFEDAFTYYYNRRKGTAADTMPDHVPHKLKLERIDRLIRLQRAIAHKKKLRALGQERIAYVEGHSRRDPGEILCRTDKNEMVVVRGGNSTSGSLLRIRLSDVSGSTFRGEVLTCHGD